MTGSTAATQCDASCCVAAPRAAQNTGTRPTIAAVDTDASAIDRSRAELVRCGSVKRVASAAGEGSVVIQQILDYLDTKAAAR